MSERSGNALVNGAAGVVVTRRFLRFDSQAEEAANYYVSIFDNS